MSLSLSLSVHVLEPVEERALDGVLVVLVGVAPGLGGRRRRAAAQPGLVVAPAVGLEENKANRWCIAKFE